MSEAFRDAMRVAFLDVMDRRGRLDGPLVDELTPQMLQYFSLADFNVMVRGRVQETLTVLARQTTVGGLPVFIPINAGPPFDRVHIDTATVDQLSQYRASVASDLVANRRQLDALDQLIEQRLKALPSVGEREVLT